MFPYAVTVHFVNTIYHVYKYILRLIVYKLKCESVNMVNLMLNNINHC